MFRKKNEKPAEKPNNEVHQTSEDPHFYNWGRSQSFTVHYFTLGMLCFITAIVAVYCYEFWKYSVIKERMTDVIFCMLAESFVVCWAICWWKEIAPKLITAKLPKRSLIFALAVVVLSTPLYVSTTYINVMQNGANPIGGTQAIFIILGGRIGLEFLFARIKYRNSPYYKKISFYDFCNMPE